MCPFSRHPHNKYPELRLFKGKRTKTRDMLSVRRNLYHVKSRVTDERLHSHRGSRVALTCEAAKFLHALEKTCNMVHAFIDVL
jgi:hypothetical protein